MLLNYENLKRVSCFGGRNIQNKTRTSQVALVIKNLPVGAGDVRDSGSIAGLGRSSEGGHGNPLYNAWLENPVDRGAWQVTIHTGAQSRTGMRWLSNFQKRLRYNLGKLIHTLNPHLHSQCLCMVSNASLLVWYYLTLLPQPSVWWNNWKTAIPSYWWGVFLCLLLSFSLDYYLFDFWDLWSLSRSKRERERERERQRERSYLRRKGIEDEWKENNTNMTA